MRISSKDFRKQCLEEGEPMTLVVSGASHELRHNQMLRITAGKPDRSGAING
jgi:hypothetical protein